jgi:hypothetical protein
MSEHTTIKRFREGMRVRSVGYSFISGVPNDMTGTVASVAGFKGKSIYSDPLKKMIFVKWDDGQQRAVFKRELERE